MLKTVYLENRLLRQVHIEPGSMSTRIYLAGLNSSAKTLPAWFPVTSAPRPQGQQAYYVK